MLKKKFEDKERDRKNRVINSIMFLVVGKEAIRIDKLENEIMNKAIALAKKIKNEEIKVILNICRRHWQKQSLNANYNDIIIYFFESENDITFIKQNLDKLLNKNEKYNLVSIENGNCLYKLEYFKIKNKTQKLGLENNKDYFKRFIKPYPNSRKYASNKK